MTILQNQEQSIVFGNNIIVVAKNKVIAGFREYPAYIISKRKTGWEISNLSMHAPLPKACIDEILSVSHEEWGWKEDRKIEAIINRYQLDWYRN